MWMSRNKGVTGAAILTAGLASLCCIGPLAGAVLGLGTFAASTVVDNLRPYMLAATGALLGAAFYSAYRRGSEKGCAGGSCAIPPGRKSHRAWLWVVAALVLLLGAFPYYSRLFWSAWDADDHAAMAATPANAGLSDVVFDVQGMTCEACATGLQATLTRKAGVTSATVNYSEQTASITYDPSKVSLERLAASIAEAGYTPSARTIG